MYWSHVFGHVGIVLAKGYPPLSPLSHTDAHTFSSLASSEGCSRFDPGQRWVSEPLDYNVSPVTNLLCNLRKPWPLSPTLLANRMKEMKEIFSKVDSILSFLLFTLQQEAQFWLTVVVPIRSHSHHFRDCLAPSCWRAVNGRLCHLLSLLNCKLLRFAWNSHTVGTREMFKSLAQVRPFPHNSVCAENHKYQRLLFPVISHCKSVNLHF